VGKELRMTMMMTQLVFPEVQNVEEEVTKQKTSWTFSELKNLPTTHQNEKTPTPTTEKKTLPQNTTIIIKVHQLLSSTLLSRPSPVTANVAVRPVVQGQITRVVVLVLQPQNQNAWIQKNRR
jgi:hypothetical protein